MIHVYHEKKVAWVSISMHMHACNPVPIVMGLRLAALRSSGIMFNDSCHIMKSVDQYHVTISGAQVYSLLRSHGF